MDLFGLVTILIFGLCGLSYIVYLLLTTIKIHQDKKNLIDMIQNDSTKESFCSFYGIPFPVMYVALFTGFVWMYYSFIGYGVVGGFHLSISDFMTGSTEFFYSLKPACDFTIKNSNLSCESVPLKKLIGSIEIHEWVSMLHQFFCFVILGASGARYVYVSFIRLDGGMQFLVGLFGGGGGPHEDNDNDDNPEGGGGAGSNLSTGNILTIKEGKEFYYDFHKIYRLMNTVKNQELKLEKYKKIISKIKRIESDYKNELKTLSNEVKKISIKYEGRYYQAGEKGDNLKLFFQSLELSLLEEMTSDLIISILSMGALSELLEEKDRTTLLKIIGESIKIQKKINDLESLIE